MDNFSNYINEQNLPYYIKFISKRISEKFCLYENNNIPQILIVSMPPRTIKTKLSTKLFANWVCENYTNKKIGIFSYSKNVTKDNIRFNIHSYLKNRVYNLNSDNIKTNILIVDDPLKCTEDIKQINDIYETFSDIVYYSLCDDPFILIICTRFGKNDLVGRILKDLKINNQTFMIDYINIEALSTKNDILNRKIGKPFDFNRYSRNNLIELKNTIGEKMFETMYQGNPQ